jgi:hypothetical protein
MWKSMKDPSLKTSASIALAYPVVDYLFARVESVSPLFDSAYVELVPVGISLLGLFFFLKAGRRYSPAGLILIGYFFLTLWLLFWAPCLCAMGRVKVAIVAIFSLLNLLYFLVGMFLGRPAPSERVPE